MMKIGILSLPIHSNYGGILQSYALQTVLKRLGHDVVVFNKNTFISINPIKILPIYLSRIILKAIGKYRGTVRFEHNKNEMKLRRCLKTQTFVDNYIKTVNFDNVGELLNYKLDAIIIGSDQVWRYQYFKNVDQKPENMFLAFADGLPVKKISYAASFATDTWELNPEATEICKMFAQKMELLSVRESNAVDMCKKYLGVDAEWVLDPTMLLNISDYQHLLNCNQTSHKLVSYILDNDPQKEEIVKRISEQYGDVYSINKPVTPAMPVEFWLEGLIGAETVVTDSFHGTAFSINFNKPFVVLSNSERGQSRLLSILKMFNLESRLVHSPEDALIVLNTPVDWPSINFLLDKYRQKSFNFLKQI